ncbi:L-aspartate oxidase [Halorutilales archaeon Cl-col2-1]
MIETDVLVIGSGISGCAAAYSALEEGADVTVVTKARRPEESNTRYAQGGIATVGDDDSVERFVEDVVEAGCGESNEEAAEVLVEEGAEAIRDVLIDEVGVGFDTRDGDYDLTKEAAHSRRRILHRGDETGAEILRDFVSYLDSTDVEILDGHTALELLGDDEVHGAVVADRERRDVFSVKAGATVLATGGVGQVYGHTTNPDVATGDGIAMAALKGARLEDTEYVQFHPTVHADREFLLSESLRGEGAKLVNEDGERFMSEYHDDLELAPRDVVARAVDDERKNREVYLDINPVIEKFDFEERFPSAYSNLTDEEFETGLVPVKPAEHFLCGGVDVDTHGRTSLDRLYAVGETARTGVHGANRLASTSLLEGLVWGLRAGRDASRKEVGGFEVEEFDSVEIDRDLPEGFCDAKFERLQSVMWEKVGLRRSEDGLEEALTEVQRVLGEARSFIRGRVDPELYSLRNATVVGLLITEAALENDESLGCHLRVSKDETENESETEALP